MVMLRYLLGLLWSISAVMISSFGRAKERPSFALLIARAVATYYVHSTCEPTMQAMTRGGLRLGREDAQKWWREASRGGSECLGC